MKKERLDVLVAERGLAESREKAQRLIQAGQVRVNGQVASKPGHKFDSASSVEVEAGPRFVSRGGDKLEAAFQTFDLQVEGMTCMDAGASTGGFTDCLLQHGAARVYAVDVGKGLIDWRLRNDKRVVVIEKQNARYLEGSMFEGTITVATIDVSFISLTKVLPAVREVITDGGHIVSLIKPQFEAGREKVGKGGVIRDPGVRQETVDTVHAFGVGELGLEWLGVCESPVRGPAGNVEYLAYWRVGDR